MVDPIGSYAGLSIQRSSNVGSIQAPASAKVKQTAGSNFGPAYQVQLSPEAQALSAAAPSASDVSSTIAGHADAILSALDGDYGRVLQSEWNKVQ